MTKGAAAHHRARGHLGVLGHGGGQAVHDAPGVHEAVVEVGGGAEGLSHPLVGHDHAGPLGQATSDGGQGTDGVTHVVERLEHPGEVERAYAGPGGGVPHLEAHPVGHAGSDGMARRLFDRGLVEVDPEQACGGQRPGQGDGRPTRPAAHVEDTGLGQSPELPAHAGSSGQPRPDVVDEHGPVHPGDPVADLRTEVPEGDPTTAAVAGDEAFEDAGNPEQGGGHAGDGGGAVGVEQRLGVAAGKGEAAPVAIVDLDVADDEDAPPPPAARATPWRSGDGCPPARRARGAWLDLRCRGRRRGRARCQGARSTAPSTRGGFRRAARTGPSVQPRGTLTNRSRSPSASRSPASSVARPTSPASCSGCPPPGW